MKKSLLAVAVAAALPTFAYAQSSVTLYGILDASIGYNDGAADGRLVPGSGWVDGNGGIRVNSGVQSGSRLGVRGSEDLGGGMKAIFTIEHRLAVDTGDQAGNKFWFGQAWVGLESGWGSLTLGRQYSPIFRSMIVSDYTGYSWYNNWAALSNAVFTSSAIVQGPFRIDNSIMYMSPTWGGLKLYAMYAPGENNAVNLGSNYQDIYGISATWVSGGINAGLGYHKINDPGVGTPTDVLAANIGWKSKAWGVSVGYTNLKDTRGNGTTIADSDITNYLLSAFLSIGPGALHLNVINTDIDITDSGISAGLAYTWPLSKRTNWYAAYGYNDLAPASGSGNANRFSIGIRHLF
jgi:predicted porin